MHNEFGENDVMRNRFFRAELSLIRLTQSSRKVRRRPSWRCTGAAAAKSTTMMLAR